MVNKSHSWPWILNSKGFGFDTKTSIFVSTHCRNRARKGGLTHFNDNMSLETGNTILKIMTSEDTMEKRIDLGSLDSGILSDDQLDGLIFIKTPKEPPVRADNASNLHFSRMKTYWAK